MTGAVLTRRNLLVAIIASVVLLQRFAIPLPGGQIGLVLPVTGVLLMCGVLRRVFVLSLSRIVAVLLIYCSAALSTLAQLAIGQVPSINSIALLVLTYLPAIVISPPDARAARSVSNFYVNLMVVCALASLVQFGGTLLRVAIPDPVTAVLPPAFVQQGFAPPDVAVTYGSEITRSQAFVFLEPSVLSLFLGFAAAIALYSGAGWLRVSVLLAGIVPTLAGNGLVSLLPALVVIVLTGRRRLLLALLPAASAAVVIAVVTPLGGLFASRSTEFSSSGSSSSLRFVQPYLDIVPKAFDTPFHSLFGHGAGSTLGYLTAISNAEVTTPIVPKVLFEYGALGFVGIFVPILLLIAGPLSARPWLVGIVIAFVFVNATLLVPVFVLYNLFWAQIISSEVDAASALDVFESSEELQSNSREGLRGVGRD